MASLEVRLSTLVCATSNIKAQLLIESGAFVVGKRHFGP